MISIVTALYKSDRYIQGYFKHLKQFIAELSQAGRRVEVIFVPREPSLLEQKMLSDAANNDWCKIVEPPLPGLYQAWNTGVLAAKGDFVGFWNVDDWRYAEGVLEAVDLLAEGNDFVFSPFRIRRYLNLFNIDILVHIQNIDRQMPEFNEQTYPDFLRSMHEGPFFMFRRDLYDRVGPFDEQFKIVADFDWCIRAAKVTRKFVRGKKFIGSFRVDGRGASSGGKSRHFAENNIVYLRHHAEDKITKVPEELIKQYDFKTLQFREKKSILTPDGLFAGENMPGWKL